MPQKRANKNRSERINEAVRQELSMIFRELKDPRVDICTSVVRTETTRDLKYCKILVSVLGDAEKKADVAAALKSAKPFIRRELALRLNLRVTPELSFVMDDSMEYSIHMEELLAQIHKDDAPEEEEGEEEEDEGEPV